MKRFIHLLKVIDFKSVNVIVSKLYLHEAHFKTRLGAHLMEKNGLVRMWDPVLILLKKSPEFIRTQCSVSLA